MTSALRGGSADVEALCTDETVLDIDGARGTVAELRETLRVVIDALTAAQRSGLTSLSNDERTLVIAPCDAGRPASRKLFLFSHSHDALIELAVYTDDADLGTLWMGEFPTPQHHSGGIAARALPQRAWSEERVLVTAASAGLGQVIAAHFAALGSSVAVHGRRERIDLPDAVGEASVVAVHGDLTTPDAAEHIVLAAADRLGGPVTILINNFGPWDAAPVVAADDDAFLGSLQAHAGVARQFSRLVAPGMREAGRGRIINISASSASRHRHGNYGLGKAVLEALTPTLAIELAPEITVNAVSPGQIVESAPVMDAIDPHAIARDLQNTPLGRFVSRAEVADAVVAMCRPEFDSLTGVVIPLDGGYRIARN
ncbi:SDR family oxidoreductase [Microbacterium sp. zg.B185]|nr:SDR family oxidoreductase [Microbacterium sp. zg.B185]